MTISLGRTITAPTAWTHLQLLVNISINVDILEPVLSRNISQTFPDTGPEERRLSVCNTLFGDRDVLTNHSALVALDRDEDV